MCCTSGSSRKKEATPPALRGSMMLVAEKAGLGSCWLSTAADMFRSEDGEKLLAQLGIPQGYAPLCIGAFGHKRAAAPPRVLSSEDNIVNIIK